MPSPPSRNRSEIAMRLHSPICMGKEAEWWRVYAANVRSQSLMLRPSSSMNTPEKQAATFHDVTRKAWSCKQYSVTFALRTFSGRRLEREEAFQHRNGLLIHKQRIPRNTRTGVFDLPTFARRELMGKKSNRNYLCCRN